MVNLKRLFLFAAVAAVALWGSGCSSRLENDHLQPEDFAVYLDRAGVKVDSIRAVPPDPFRASSGVAIEVAGSEIGVYKYHQSSKIQAERIKHLEKTGRTYINGIPYPVEVGGSFMILGLDKNPKKKQIIEVLHNFK